MTLGLLIAPGDADVALWTVAALLAALLLDGIFGEPDALWRRAPHPAVLMGRAVAMLDRVLNRGPARRAAGALAILFLLAAAAGVGAVLAAAPVIGAAASTLGAAILFAHRSLIDHVLAVADGLDAGLPEGRRAVSMIVGRDPERLDEAGVARAAIESAAENFSDGVVAPAFWFLLFGLPGVCAYKMLNTADSMIGHRTERHLRFGWAAARLDDVANLGPARLSAALIAFGGVRTAASLRAAWRDARRHASPNAGWPEAAMAGALDLALAGPRVYNGRETDDAVLHPSGRRAAVVADIRRAAARAQGAWMVMTFAAAGAFSALLLSV